jgi:glutamyl-Q tRNA(Asp) synthetase
MHNVTRFAPSPTGRLHLGHAYSALLAHDFARARGGRFLLRIEDLDLSRARREHVEHIFEDLTWLGLTWDGVVIHQSARLAAYEDALQHLKDQDLVSPSLCTRADIAASASAPQGRRATLYPGTCRALTRADLSRPHAWRLDMKRALASPAVRGAAPLTFRERDCLVDARPETLGDVVLGRKDASASYHLAVVIDDAFQGVTDIVRGRDLLEATHVQRLLQALLGLAQPSYHHHRLVLDGQGHRLAKRRGSPSLAQIREAGTDPLGLVDRLRRGQYPSGYSLEEA